MSKMISNNSYEAFLYDNCFVKAQSGLHTTLLSLRPKVILKPCHSEDTNDSKNDEKYGKIKIM